jgi:hypothetical protein
VPRFPFFLHPCVYVISHSTRALCQGMALNEHALMSAESAAWEPVGFVFVLFSPPKE